MMSRIFAIVLLFGSSLAFGQVNKPEIAFVVKEKDLFPEGITHNPADGFFYVSSIYKNKIIRISPKGEIADFTTNGADGLEQVLGMKVDSKGMLWACNNPPDYDTIRKLSNIHVYDTKRKTLFRKFQISDGSSHLFNDLCIASNGDVYVSDTNAGMVWLIKHGENDIVQFTKPGSVFGANGIALTPDEKKLLVSTAGAMGIASISIDSRKIEAFPTERYLVVGIDGLCFYKNYLIGIQNTTFPEGILKMDLDDRYTRITKVGLLMEAQPQFDIPTTGVVVGEYFYFLANSQMLHIVGQRGKINEAETVKDFFIMKIKLH